MARARQEVRRSGAVADAQPKAPAGGAKRPPTAAQRMKRAAAIHRWTRLGIQLGFFVLAPAAFSGAFNGVKYLFTQIGGFGAIEATSFLVLLVAVLAFTVVFGRFFCGYACAFGTLGDVLFGAFDFLRSKTPLPRAAFPTGLVRALSLVKYLVLAAICAACAAGAWSSWSGHSPWVAFAGVLSGSVEGVGPVAFAVLGAVMAGMIVRERFFCQFLCPLGAVFSLLPVLGFSEFTRTRAHCARNCGKCREACPVDIWPDADVLVHGECVSCGRCADVCPMANVNLVAIERAKGKGVGAESGKDAEPRPVRKTAQAWRVLRGTESGVVAVKAVALLVVLWVSGAVRYVPAFSSLFG